MKLSLIVAVAENGVIGRDNDLPWRLPKDLARFKALTVGHPVIMGRRTFESIGLPLPQRRNIVLSRDPGYAAAGVEVVASLDAALELLAAEHEVFVLGGAALFSATLALADRLFLTRVHAEVAGDTYFPPLDQQRWRLLEEERHEPDAANPLPFSFQVWEPARSQANDAPGPAAR